MKSNAELSLCQTNLNFRVTQHFTNQGRLNCICFSLLTLLGEFQAIGSQEFKKIQFIGAKQSTELTLGSKSNIAKNQLRRKKSNPTIK